MTLTYSPINENSYKIVPEQYHKCSMCGSKSVKEYSQIFSFYRIRTCSHVLCNGCHINFEKEGGKCPRCYVPFTKIDLIKYSTNFIWI